MEKRKTIVIAAIVVAIFVTSLSMGCVDQQKEESVTEEHQESKEVVQTDDAAQKLKESEGVKKEPDSSDSNEVLLTAADNGTEVGVKNGQALAVVLDSNPTTGYEWEVAEAPDVQVLQQVSEIEYESAPNPEDMVGVGGVQTIRFNVVGAGRTALKMVYRRSWEKDEAPAEIFAIDVVAR
ncbi:putative secreted protein [Candidatus Methanophagaceae archaeon]|nr:putative secreted protein [Methanophagales archaeon]